MKNAANTRSAANHAAITINIGDLASYSVTCDDGSLASFRPSRGRPRSATGSRQPQVHLVGPVPPGLPALLAAGCPSSPSANREGGRDVEDRVDLGRSGLRDGAGA